MTKLFVSFFNPHNIKMIDLLLSTYGMAPPSYVTTPLPGRGEGCGKDPKLTNKRRKYEKKK